MIRTRDRLTLPIAALAITLLLACTGCGGGKPALVPSARDVEPAVTIFVVDNRFEPAEVEIERGQAVRWVFNGRDQHDVVADDGSFVSELMTEGEYLHVFAETGKFDYDCSIHPEMRGVVKVV